MRLRHHLLRVTRVGLAALFLVVFFLYGMGAIVELNTEQLEASRFKPTGQMYDIGGLKLHLYCLGQSVPDQAAIILVAGEGDNLYTWWNLQHQLAASGLVCSYDRSGYGWSETGPRTRTGAALAEELQALLAAAGIQPPYILVGHAFGGLIVRQYALEYPDEADGLVLIDSLDAEAISRLPGLLRKPLLMIPAIESGAGAILQTAGALRLLDRWGRMQYSPVLAILPDEVLPAARAVYFNPRGLATAAREQVAVADTALALVERKLPGDLPIITLLASSANGQEISPNVLRDYTDLSSNSQIRQLPETGHYIHLMAPGQVVQAIWELRSR